MLISDILPKLTAPKLLKDNSFEKPQLINPNILSSFEDLLVYRNEIRDLKLVPVKDDQMYRYYNTFDRKILAKEMAQKLRHSEIHLETNQFPYWLPNDINQRIIWIKDNVSTRQVVEFMIKIIEKEKIPDFLSFERPLDNKIALVKGSIPQIRHIHFWTKL